MLCTSCEIHIRNSSSLPRASPTDGKMMITKKCCSAGGQERHLITLASLTRKYPRCKIIYCYCSILFNDNSIYIQIRSTFNKRKSVLKKVFFCSLSHEDRFEKVVASIALLETSFVRQGSFRTSKRAPHLSQPLKRPLFPHDTQPCLRSS